MILNLSLAVVRWIFGPSREAFSVYVPHKKCPFVGTLEVDPLPEGAMISDDDDSLSQSIQNQRENLVVVTS